MENVTFESMGLPEYILQAVKEQGFAHPTPIQALAVPPLMEWKDIIAKAPTGSGKTFAFGIPVLVHTDTESGDIQTMILSDVMYGEMKTELRSKLKGASKMTTLCAMIAACKNSGKVFKYDVIADELATSLSKEVEKPSKDSLKRYIDNGSANVKARIFVNTEAAIKNYIKNKSDNRSG